MTTSRGDTTAAPLSSVSPQLEAAAEAGGGQLVAGGWAEPAQAASSLYTQQRHHQSGHCHTVTTHSVRDRAA